MLQHSQRAYKGSDLLPLENGKLLSLLQSAQGEAGCTRFTQSVSRILEREFRPIGCPRRPASLHNGTVESNQSRGRRNNDAYKQARKGRIVAHFQSRRRHLFADTCLLRLPNRRDVLESTVHFCKIIARPRDGQPNEQFSPSPGELTCAQGTKSSLGP